MYINLVRVLVIWFWRVPELKAWGFSLTKAHAKAAARRRILKVRPDASEATRVLGEEIEFIPADLDRPRRRRYGGR